VRKLDDWASEVVLNGSIKADILENEIELMRFLKVWTSSWIPRAVALEADQSRDWNAGELVPDLERLLPNHDYWRMPTRSLYEIFAKNKYAAICGHIAWTLMSVYESFGFTAFTYSYGKPPISVLTHVITLVKLSNGNFYLSDADFGAEFFLGSTDRQIKKSLQKITTQSEGVVHEHEILTRNFIGDLAHFSDTSNNNNYFPPIKDFISLKEGVHLEDNRILFKGIKNGPDSWKSGYQYESAIKFLISEGRMANLNALIGYPMGISSRKFGWIDNLNCESSEAKFLWDLFITFDSSR